jgi:hypothetical protein
MPRGELANSRHARQVIRVHWKRAQVRRALNSVELEAERRRREVVLKYARRNATGHVVRCTPGPDDDLRERSIGKVVYDTRRSANRCARVLNTSPYEATNRREQRAYPCTRGESENHEHWHLTSRTYLDGEVIADDDGGGRDD